MFGTAHPPICPSIRPSTLYVFVSNQIRPSVQDPKVGSFSMESAIETTFSTGPQGGQFLHEKCTSFLPLNFLVNAGLMSCLHNFPRFLNKFGQAAFGDLAGRTD